MGLLLTVTCGIAMQLGPIKTYKQHTAEGLFVCGDVTNGQVKITLPPVQGQFMAQTRDNVTDLFDFDNRPESKGAWFWKETIQKTPAYVISLSQTTLPIILSTSSGLTGIQTGELQFVPPMHSLNLTYSCNGESIRHGTTTPTSSGAGLGSCLAYKGAKQTVTMQLPPKSVTRLVGCVNDVFATSDVQTKGWDFDAKDCDLDVRVLTAEGQKQGRIVYRAQERTGLLPKPIAGRWPFDAVANAEDANGYYSWGANGQFSWRSK